jgi:hypothetical protein
MTSNIGAQRQAGCMACHGDQDLTKLIAGHEVSFYVDEKAFAASAHRDLACLACHVDFSYNGHASSKDEWKTIAGLACRNCHTRSWSLYQQGVHGRGGHLKPTCPNCHGSHDIGMLSRDPAARAKLDSRAYQACGRCHRRYWTNYGDYYHGAAYKFGAEDAPACWGCHRAHDIYPSREARSATSASRLASTCGACHEGVRKPFMDYTALVHRGAAVRHSNFIAQGFTTLGNKLASWLDVLARNALAGLQ